MSLFRPSQGVIGSPALDAFYLGRYRDEQTGKIGPKIQFPGTEPIVIIGRNRSGKDAGIGNYNGLQLEGKSWFVIDPRGEATAICAPYRRKLGPVYIVNPFGVLTNIPGYRDLQSDGFNALVALGDPDAPLFFDHSAGLSEALIKIEGKDPHFDRRSREFVLAHSMNEVVAAKNEQRTPLLANVKAAIGEADERDPATGQLVKGVTVTAARLVESGGPQIANLLGAFTDDNDEVKSVRATASGQSQWMLSEPMREDERKNGLPLDELGQRPVSVFCILPSEMVETHSIWFRVLVSSALRSLYRPSPTVCTFWINEFASLQRLGPVENSLGLVAGSGIQLIIVVQSLTQLHQLYENGWENFLGMAGAVALVGPPGDAFTAEYLSKRSGEKTICQPNVGISINPGGVGLSNGEAYTRRQYLMPMDLYDLQPGFGFVWAAGLANPIPAYFPPYWDVERLNRRARANPYYRG
jgi:type IV secretion system protein VirD4